MPDDDVRVPAGWYPDPLGLPQLRWWDNHAWTEHISDARQPMMATETVTSKLAYADDDPADDLPFADEADRELSRRERRERERLSEVGDADRDPTAPAAAFADPLRSLEAPERDRIPVEDPAAGIQLASSGQLEDAPTSAPYELDTRFDDLLGEASVPRSAFAHVSESATSFVPVNPAEHGWGADPQQTDVRQGDPRQSGPADQSFADTRFDDRRGAGHPAEPWQGEFARTRVITDVPTSTGPAWLLTLIPLYTLVVGLLLLLSGVAQTPTPVVIVLMFGVPYVAGIVFSILDYRALKRAGIVEPAHWIWSVLTVLVYLIARLTSTVREAGTGFGPLLTFLVLGVGTLLANVAVPGLIIQLAPASFAHQAEASIMQDASSLGTRLTVTCPTTPPLIPQQSFVCQAHKPGGGTYDVTVSLQRSNGWIDWRVDDWGVFSAQG
ncbi:DUF2510 domain-containing protein [Lysinimonas soli]|uniref:DUF2510 domain-containing protein n=1 Tax=Lysinimonas soli TaxID=1074233 RepID=A0ABW0NMN5_9MICO